MQKHSSLEYFSRKRYIFLISQSDTASNFWEFFNSFFCDIFRGDITSRILNIIFCVRFYLKKIWNRTRFIYLFPAFFTFFISVKNQCWHPLYRNIIYVSYMYHICITHRNVHRKLWLHLLHNDDCCTAYILIFVINFYQYQENISSRFVRNSETLL